MRTIILALLLSVGCGEDSVPPPGGNNPDAPVEVDAPGPDAPGGTLTLDCVSYCGANLATCTDALAQYESMASCLGMCEHLPVGTLGDATGNTLACRVKHTEFAQADATTHCEHSGPGGGSMCGLSSCGASVGGADHRPVHGGRPRAALTSVPQ
jgi:hypothetical protein